MSRDFSADVLANFRILQARQSGNSKEICEDCGNDIPLERQKLIPGVFLCVDCKEESEKIKGRFW